MAHYLVMAEIQKLGKKQKVVTLTMSYYTLLYITLYGWKGHKAVSACALSIQSIGSILYVCACVCVCACVGACVHVRVPVGACARARGCM